MALQETSLPEVVLLEKLNYGRFWFWEKWSCRGLNKAIDILEDQSLVLSTWRKGPTTAKDDRVKVIMITASGLDVLFPQKESSDDW